MAHHFNIILNDLLLTTPEEVIIPEIPDVQVLDSKMKVHAMARFIRRALRMKNRKKSLWFAYYFGEMVESDEALRRIAKHELSGYYFTCIVRTYYLFEFCPEQIGRTQKMQLSNIRSLTADDYRRLIDRD
jgi:hypothetical protein